MWTRSDIELEARRLLAEIERHAATLWPHTQPERLYMCDPEAACRVLGLQYLPDQHLGKYGGTATAGVMDRRHKAILLSSEQRFDILRFTAAHEIGHYLLHADDMLLRDRAIAHHGDVGRDSKEGEADYFAACLLAPPKLLRAAFKARFPVGEPMTNTLTNCYALSRTDHQRLASLNPGSSEFTLAVARAQSFDGAPFKSLVKLFNISPTAMTRRLQELELVA
jgi:hypothetical protein